MSKEKIQDIEKLLADKFKMKDLGEIKEYLGTNVEYDYYEKKKKKKKKLNEPNSDKMYSVISKQV